jgi:hypothetical protein
VVLVLVLVLVLALGTIGSAIGIFLLGARGRQRRVRVAGVSVGR